MELEHEFWEKYNEYIACKKRIDYNKADQCALDMKYIAEQMNNKNGHCFFYMSVFCELDLKYRYTVNPELSLYLTCLGEGEKTRLPSSSIFNRRFLKFCCNNEQILGFNPCRALFGSAYLIQYERDDAVAILKKAVKCFPDTYKGLYEDYLDFEKAVLGSGYCENTEEAYSAYCIKMAKSSIELGAEKNPFMGNALGLNILTVQYHTIFRNDDRAEELLLYAQIAVEFKRSLKSEYLRLNPGGDADRALMNVMTKDFEEYIEKGIRYHNYSNRELTAKLQRALREYKEI